MAGVGGAVLPVTALLIDPAAQPVRNLHRNPGILAPGGQYADMLGFWGGSSPNVAADGGSVTVPWSLSGRARRVVWTTRGHVTGDVGMGLSAGWAATLAQIVGRRTTAVFDLAFSVGGWTLPAGHMTVSNVSRPGTTTAAGTIHASSPAQAVTAGVPVRCWVTFTVPADATAITSIRAGLTAMPLVNGVSVECSNLDLYLGDYQPDRVPGSGTLPGWRWAGDAWASESVGWPYTLESIAGRPLASLYRAATAQSVALDLPGDTLLSMYGVGARRGQPFLNLARAQTATARQALVLQESSATAGQAVAGFGQLDPAVTAYARASGTVTDDPIVLGAVRVSPTSGRLLYGTGASVVAPTGSLPERIASFRHVSAATADQWDAVHLYAGAHNDETGRRIMAWLARRYGAPVPAGY